MAAPRSAPTPSLPTALSQALIAFTIEFDNEFEHRIEHHTGNKAGSGVWLTSMVMWSNFMRLIPAGGVALRAVECRGARVWGPSARFAGQLVGREHEVMDGDQVEVVTR